MAPDPTAEPAGSLRHVYAIGVALLVGAILIPVLWTPASTRWMRPPKDKPSSAKPKCHRVQEIPIETTKEDLLRNLTRRLPWRAQDPVSLRLTLTPSSAKHCTATFVSSEHPKHLEYPVDSKFIGITPLFGKANAAVE